MDCSPPGSFVQGILQARILELLSFPSPEDLADPGTEPRSPASPAGAGGSFTTEPPESYHIHTVVILISALSYG